MWQKFQESKFISFLSLFTSFGTLVCCALPSTLVLLGFGASLVGFLGKYPQLIWLSDHKEWVFGVSFFMLGVSYLAQRLAQKKACPIDKREDCESTKNWARPLLLITFGINIIGAFYAFVLPRLL
jgi:hypothetical protein